MDPPSALPAATVGAVAATNAAKHMHTHALRLCCCRRR